MKSPWVAVGGGGVKAQMEEIKQGSGVLNYSWVRRFWSWLHTDLGLVLGLVKS